MTDDTVANEPQYEEGNSVMMRLPQGWYERPTRWNAFRKAVRRFAARLACCVRGHVWKFHDATTTDEKTKTTMCRFWSECRHCGAIKNDRTVDVSTMFGKRKSAR